MIACAEVVKQKIIKGFNSVGFKAGATGQHFPGGAGKTFQNPSQKSLLAQTRRWALGSSPRNTAVFLRVEHRVRLDFEPKSVF
jgi:hypothetical protein